MRVKPEIPLAFVLLLPGCVSTANLRERAPDLDQVATGAPEKVAGCIGDKLEASPVASQNGQATLSSRPTTNGYSISEVQTAGGLYGASSDTIVLVDITKVDTGSRVQLFTHFMTGNGGMPALIKPCL